LARGTRSAIADGSAFDAIEVGLIAFVKIGAAFDDGGTADGCGTLRASGTVFMFVVRMARLAVTFLCVRRGQLATHLRALFQQNRFPRQSDAVAFHR